MTDKTYQNGFGLGAKFALLIVVILVTTLGINTCFFIDSQNSRFKQQLELRGRMIGYFSALTIPEAIVTYDFVLLDNMTRDMSAQDDITYAIIVNEFNHPLTTYVDEKNPNIANAIHKAGSNEVKDILKYLHGDKEIIHMNFPVKTQEELHGYVYIGVSKRQLTEFVSSTVFHQSMIQGLIILFLIGCIYLVFRQSVLRAINSLVSASRHVIKGDLEHRCEITSHDELGYLMTCFNRMVNRLQITSQEKDDALNELHDLNEKLESVVEEQVSIIRSKEAWLAVIFDNIKDGIVVLDKNGFVESVNNAAQIMLGVTAQECVGLHFIMFLSDDIEYIDDSVSSYNDEYDGPFSFTRIRREAEYQARHADGSVFPMEVLGTKMIIDQEHYRICVLRDITERKETEKKLAEAQEKLFEAAHRSGMAEMATGVLHNIGNILNSVCVSAEQVKGIVDSGNINKLQKANGLLADNLHHISDYLSNDSRGKKLPEFFIKLGDILAKENNNLQEEVDTLRDKLEMMREVIFTQQEYAKIKFQEEIIDVKSVIEDALRLHTASFIKAGIEVHLHINHVPECVGHKSKLLQVLTNLLVNARQAIVDSGHTRDRSVSICARQKGGFVEISVVDTGVGIDEGDLQKIFTHGYTTKEHGHGFGLHTSANAMKEMKGDLQVRSTGVGMGACFILCLPVAQFMRDEQIIQVSTN